MNDYYKAQFTFSPYSEVESDVLSALLCDAGFESFVPEEPILTAYVKKELYDASAVEEALKNPIFGSEIIWTVELEEGQDWNAEWEKNYFKPIVVGDRCVIHSSFHTDIPRAEYDIVIDPKMAFGTGHHSTTSLIIRQLLEADLKGRSVIDMGTGTGILAILAAMRGASPVTAIEIDAFAYENAVENVRLNGHAQIKVLNGDASLLEGIAPADVFIANINRNVITGDLDRYAPAVKAGGMMLLSGFYQGDDADIVSRAAAEQRFDTVGMSVDNNWCCLKLIKN